MHSTGKIEDRVFGLADRLPPLPLVTRESKEYDLLSVSVDGAEVAYAQQGRLALPPLVMLHGWAASHKFWKYCFSAFSPRWRVIAPDLVGFGISEKPKRDYTLDGLASWLGKFLDAMKLDRVTLVAHSMGGTIALLYALQNPGRIEKLVVSNPVIVGRTAFSRRNRLCMKMGIRRLLYHLAKIGPIRRWVAKDFTTIGPLDADLALDVTKGTYQSMFDSVLSTGKVDLREKMASLSVPTLSIGTDLDQLVATEQYDMVPAQQKTRITGSGHIPMIERPEEFNRVLNDFLTGH
ncbi:MAG: alpha/beta hydrolase [Planctomycetota bacterium]|nr:MAG: alpha/beta hydrolase [Planctomycetota bacterium]